MIDLTEKWKKGELPEGWYWVKRVTWSECINMLYNWSDTFLDGDVPVDNDNIIEVLAKVPDYEEWQALNQNLDSTMQTNKALCKKLAELKELLRECKGIFDECFSPSVKYGELYKQIDEVLK